MYCVCYLSSLLPVFNTLLDKMEGGANSARLAIGQAIALLFELAREVDSDLLDSADSNETYSLVEQLATESNRYTARKERNQIRAHFRDVLQTLNVSRSYSIVILRVGRSIELFCDMYTHTHTHTYTCLLYTSPSPRDATLSRMPSSA